MKRRLMLKGIKPIYFILSLLLSGCQSASVKPSIDHNESSNIIDQTKSLFSINDYSQSVDTWIPLHSETINSPLITSSVQQHHYSNLKSHYFGMTAKDKSPWNSGYITSVLNKNVENIRNTNINQYLSKTSWGANFRVNSTQWKTQIKTNAQTQIDKNYHPANRSIATKETLVRVLPSDDPAYADPRQAGEGYPFDNLQMSAIRPGTPLYVITESRDKRWKYVISPTVTGWVHSEDIASVDQAFIDNWLFMVQKNLGAFIKDSVSIHENELYYFTARPGTILPFKSQKFNVFSVAIPVRDINGKARIRWINLKNDEFIAMPWEMTPKNIATLMKTMGNKPYGWGNYNFYNDCSAEIRSLLMPFGIFLPRNSAAQIQASPRIVDLSKENITTRISYLKQHGKPFTTLVYIQGHIMLYIGNEKMNGKLVPMTYQNIWGLRPEDKKNRSIIGSSVFLPLLTSYPSHPELESLAGKKLFKLGFIE
ncbi:TPA: SH3 domain-containing protein [Providencia alcalifaciens]